jgi:ABC-type transporter Mla subunit MlaD
MPILPSVGELYRAADAVDATAALVEVDMANVARLVEGLPWRGNRREVAHAAVTAATSAGLQQAAAERELARALRRLAGDVERELRVLADLAQRARRHLEDLLRRAKALVEAAAAIVAEAAARTAARVVVEVMTFDPVGALCEARAVADEAADRLRRITMRLGSLPEPSDPQWRRLGPEILGWSPL